MPEASEPVVELRPARISERFVAYLIDLVPFLLGFGASVYVAVGVLRAAPPTPESIRKLGWVWVALVVAYQFAGNLAGGTVGKRLMGLAVVRRDGRPLGAARALARALGWLVSTPLFNFGFVLALVHPESRALHDLLAGSLVVEGRPKDRAETLLLFAGAVCAMTALFGGNLYLQWQSPLPSDLLAVEKAREGLQILARVEEAHKERHGRYTDSLAELAEASGDVEQFKQALLEIFDPNLFRVEAGPKGYRISAAAKDRAKTRVHIQGP